MSASEPRDGIPLPGLTVPDVVSQLIWRTLGPYKGRARSVLDWVGTDTAPPMSFVEIANRDGITPPAVRHRVLRVAAAGRRLPLTDSIRAELDRPTQPGENTETRRRSAWLLGQDTHRRPIRK